MKKHLAFYLGWSAFLLLLAGCEQSDSPTDSAGNGKPVIVDFTVAGIADYGDNQSAGSRAEDTPAPFSVSTPINDEYEMEATFTPDPSTTSRAAATRAALGEGIYYRVAAYRNEGYVGHADYKITNASSSLVSDPLILEPGTYLFLAYSHNNNSPITDNDVASESREIAVNVDNDVLYWTEEKTISTHTSLSISFKHLFMQMKVKFDATELGCDFKTASATLDAAGSSSLYKTAGWGIDGDGFNGMSIKHVPNLHFSNISGQTITSDSQRLLPFGASKMALTVNVGFTAGGGMADVNKTLNLASIDLKRNYSYTCTVKFKPSGISLDGNDVTGYPYGGGNCWLIHPSLASGTFSFDATKEGQSTDPVGTIVIPSDATRTAKVMWESTLGMISKPTYKDGRIVFGLDGTMGNALLAVTDGTGKILWSWHIWVADVHITSSPNPGDFLEANLGSLNYTDPGLFYQCGRKDPIRRENGVNQIVGRVDVASSVQNPDKFITGDPTNAYWWCTKQVLITWQDDKRHDPCPKGYIVPFNNTFNGMSLANVDGGWNSGYRWSGKGSFQVGGMRRAEDGSLDGVDTQGYYRTIGSEGMGSLQFYISESEVRNRISFKLADGFLVRCIRK